MTEALRTEAMDAASGELLHSAEESNFELEAGDPRSRRMGDDEEFESDDYADESEDDEPLDERGYWGDDEEDDDPGTFIESADGEGGGVDSEDSFER